MFRGLILFPTSVDKEVGEYCVLVCFRVTQRDRGEVTIDVSTTRNASGQRQYDIREWERWAELITKAVRHRGKIYTAADGDAYLQALCDEQPSNIVGYLRIL